MQATSFDLTMAEAMNFAAIDVTGDDVPDFGHRIMEEHLVATAALDGRVPRAKT